MSYYRKFDELPWNDIIKRILKQEITLFDECDVDGGYSTGNRNKDKIRLIMRTIRVIICVLQL